VALQLNLLAQSLLAAGCKVTVEWRPAANVRHDLQDIERLGEAILREPEFVEAFLSLPETEVDGEVFSVLSAVLERALRKHPEYADLHYHCGAVHRRLGHTQAALRHAERAVELNANYVNALILLADLYGRTDRWKAGVERLEQAIRAGANYPDVHYLMGRLFQSGGEIDRARQAYRRALELNGDYPAAKEALAALAA
jgi:tetratricopeptide (TPR) repeat protein